MLCVCFVVFVLLFWFDMSVVIRVVVLCCGLCGLGSMCVFVLVCCCVVYCLFCIVCCVVFALCLCVV